jgi:hypothetical protein
MKIKRWNGALCVICGPRFRAVLNWSGAEACCLFGILFFRSWAAYNNKLTRLHEYAHFLQGHRDWLFSLKYLLASARYSWEENPYEIEAERFSAYHARAPLSSFSPGDKEAWRSGRALLLRKSP